jgi:hypothetical protein
MRTNQTIVIILVIIVNKKKINYPYVRDNITDVLHYEGPSKYCTEALTQKINQNPFNILKKVDKFSWQK